MPTASGTDRILFGPSPMTRSELMPAELAVDLLDRNTGAERQADETAQRLDVGHQGATGLAQGHEDLEGLTPVVLGDGDVQRSQRRLHPAGGAAQHLGAGALLPPLQILGLQLVDDPLQAARSRPAARRSRRAGPRHSTAIGLSALAPFPPSPPCPSCTFLAVDPVESTCISRLPSR